MDTQHGNYVKHYRAALAGEIDDTPDASDYCDCENGSPLTEECVNFCLGEAVEARNAMPEPEQQQALRWINEGASEAMGRAITQTIEWTAAEYREPLLPVTTYAEDHGGAAYSYADDLINGRLFGQWRKEVRDGALRAFDQAMAEFGVDMIGIRYRGLLDFLDQPYRYGQTSYTEFVMSAWANAGRGD